MDAILADSVMVSSGGFNPRARDGRDLDSHRELLKIRVSIHAPVMDAILVIKTV